MDSLLGGGMPGALKFVIAFVFVLALIGVSAWLVRRFGVNRFAGGAARGRQPRLAVIDAAAVDGRRRLVLVRRDNVEHLLMIGGPTDVVIEPNIVRAAPATREAAPARPAPTVAEASLWPLAPQAEPAVRQQRGDEIARNWPTPPPLHAEITPRPPIPEPVDLVDALAAHVPPRIEPVLPVEPEPASSYATPSNDQNLAEMAQRLEAALRRPPGGEPRLDIPLEPPAPEPVAAPSDAAAEAPPVPAQTAPTTEPRPQRGEAKPGKNFYESLEQEMASLLGRPTGKT